MQNIVLILLLIFALGLIGIVLVQRSEGGGLGIGGGGGGGMGGRPKANPLAKLTWILAAGFFACSIAMTVINSQNTTGSLVLENAPVDADGDVELPPSPLGDDLLPPSPEGADAASDDTLTPGLPPKAE